MDTEQLGPSMVDTVTVNESLKRIVEAAEKIDLVAVNALLVARRAGHASAGFGVVSAELRQFSSKVTEAMAAIDILINELVQQIAYLSKMRRRVALWARTESAGQVLVDKQQHLHTETVLAVESWDKLRRDIRGALSLCRYGVMLSSNGRIEAAYGGTMLGDMRTVVTEVESIIDTVVRGLKNLHASLGEST